MEFQLETAVREFDERSAQFSCEVTISNSGTTAFEIVAASPRLPKGVKINEAADAFEMQLSQRHLSLCTRLEHMIGTSLITHSKEEAANYVGQMQGWMREVVH